MAGLMPMMIFAIGFCNVFGQNQEKKMLDSVLNRFVTDTGDAMGLHKSLKFLGLPSNLDVSSLTFDDPIRMYKFVIDTSLVKSTDFKIKNIIKPIDAWKVPFKYDGRYCSVLTIEKAEGNYVVGDLAQNDTEPWAKVEKLVGKDKRKRVKLLYLGGTSFFHFPDIDEYNILPLYLFDGLDTTSNVALSSPLKINAFKVREMLREEIFKGSRRGVK
jgi:hypothetical protein